MGRAGAQHRNGDTAGADGHGLGKEVIAALSIMNNH
jgi:hypothetical protein